MIDANGNRNGQPQIRGDSPAFPVSIPGAGDNGWHGMSLRDWFAAQALNGLLQNLMIQGSFDHGIRRNAQAAYDLADEMLKVRNRICETCGGRGEVGGTLQDGSSQTDPCLDCAAITPCHHEGET